MAQELELLLDTRHACPPVAGPGSQASVRPSPRSAGGPSQPRQYERGVGELVTKEALERIEGEGGVAALVAALVASPSLAVVDVRWPDVMGVASLPAAHQDPFDRLLLSQAIYDGLTLVSRDRAFVGYPLKNVVVMGSDVGGPYGTCYRAPPARDGSAPGRLASARRNRMPGRPERETSPMATNPVRLSTVWDATFSARADACSTVRP